jgi:hypothetical protein
MAPINFDAVPSDPVTNCFGSYCYGSLVPYLKDYRKVDRPIPYYYNEKLFRSVYLGSSLNDDYPEKGLL